MSDHCAFWHRVYGLYINNENTSVMISYLSDKISSTVHTNFNQVFGLSFDRPSSGKISRCHEIQGLNIGTKQEKTNDKSNRREKITKK